MPIFALWPALKAAFTGMKLYILIAVIAIVLGGYMIHVHQMNVKQQQMVTVQTQLAVETIKEQSATKVLHQYETDLKKQTEINKQLTDQIANSVKVVEKTRAKFKSHINKKTGKQQSFGDWAAESPVEVQSRMNAATGKALDCINMISGLPILVTGCE